MGKVYARAPRRIRRRFIPLFATPAMSSGIFELWCTSRSRTVAVNQWNLRPYRAKEGERSSRADPKDLGAFAGVTQIATQIARGAVSRVRNGSVPIRWLSLVPLTGLFQLAKLRAIGALRSHSVGEPRMPFWVTFPRHRIRTT